MKRMFTLLAVLLFCSAAWAGIAPKPEMDFSFTYNTSAQPAIAPDLSEQIQCADSLCIEARPLGEEGIQKLYCSNASCFSVAHEYEPFQKLIIYFSDGTKKESNIFKTPNQLRSSFNVIVNDDSLHIEKTITRKDRNILLRTDVWVSFILIILLELVAAFAFLSYTQKNFSILYSVFFVNFLTFPLSWLFLSRLFTGTAVVWIFCLLFEAIFIWAVNRRKINLYDSAILSLAINVTSYSVGMIITYAISPFLF